MAGFTSVLAPSARPPVRPSAPWEHRGGLWLRIKDRIQTCAADFRRIVGMPDYAAYLQHLERFHPDWPVPSEREFFQLYIEARYGSGLSRCC